MSKEQNSNKQEAKAPAEIPQRLKQQIEKLAIEWQREVLVQIAIKGEEIPGWALRPIDYTFRPRSYWAVADLRKLIANIKGAERKKDALRLLKENRIEQAYDFILADTLDDGQRELFGSLHPALLGGEYLPDYQRGEVEIARVTMDSTTQDVISIRARPGTKAQPIIYRLVDEYETEYRFVPAFSTQPLTLGELVNLIDTSSSDGSGIGLDIIQTNFDCNDEPAEHYAGFLHFSSEFYDELGPHYWFAERKWVRDNASRPQRQKSEQELAIEETAEYLLRGIFGGSGKGGQ